MREIGYTILLVIILIGDYYANIKEATAETEGFGAKALVSAQIWSEGAQSQ